MGPEPLLVSLLAFLLAVVAARRVRVRTPADLPPCADWRHNACPATSVIVPARNEADNLPRLLGSLRRQTPPFREIIVVDDASEDDTAAVARAHGARVLASQPLPSDWRGKPWACYQGACAASGEWLLFLDADVWMPEGGWAELLTRFPREGTALSLLPDHVVQRPCEQLSAVFNLVMAWSVGILTPAGRPAHRPALFGQSLLVDRRTYKRCGGHAAVRECMLENLHLARRIRSSGASLDAVAGRGVLRMRMYPRGLRQLIAGWSKTFAQGLSGSAPAATRWVALWIGAGWLMAAGVLLSAASRPGHAPWRLPAWIALYAAYAGISGRWLRGLGNYRRASIALYPVLLLFFQLVFFRSLRIARGRTDAEWKGRRIKIRS